jgi:hypothetical protein
LRRGDSSRSRRVWDAWGAEITLYYLNIGSSKMSANAAREPLSAISV